MAHKDNWPESTWTSHQGPTLAIISPRGAICKMNILIKTAVCVHAYVCVSHGVNLEAGQIYGNKNTCLSIKV